jgi:TPR repeat protein
MIWAGLAGGVLAVGVVGAAAAGPWEDGETAYEHGDYATALRYWRPLAEEGSAAAQNNLATIYHAGQGVPRDDALSFQWLRKAADNGDPNAEFTLGLAYASGDGEPQDDVQAAAWYRKAADQGQPAAQAMLGVAYYRGQGVAQDYVAAYMWVELGAAGFAKSNPKLSQESTQSRDSFAAKMTPAQIAEAQRLAAEWKPK